MGGHYPRTRWRRKVQMGLLLHTWKCFQGFCVLPPIHSCRIPRICQLESPEAAAGGPGPPRAPARGRALAMAPSPGREGGSAAGARTARVGRASALTRALGPSLLLTRGVIRVPRHVRGPRERQLQSKGCTGGRLDPGRTQAPAIRRWKEAARWW